MDTDIAKNIFLLSTISYEEKHFLKTLFYQIQSDLNPLARSTLGVKS